VSSSTVGLNHRQSIARGAFIVDYDPRTGQWEATHRDFIIEPLAVKNKRGKLLALLRGFEAVGRRAAIAAAGKTFPNDKGNYTKKRQPRPAGMPLAPRERFNLLRAYFLSRRQTYRNPPRRTPAERRLRRAIVDELMWRELVARLHAAFASGGAHGK
jgi:hypothetical protein